MEKAYVLLTIATLTLPELTKMAEDISKIPAVKEWHRTIGSEYDAVLTVEGESEDKIHQIVYSKPDGIRWLDGITSVKILLWLNSFPDSP